MALPLPTLVATLVTSFVISDEQTIQLLADALEIEKSCAEAVPVDTLVATFVELVSADELQTRQAVVVAL